MPRAPVAPAAPAASRTVAVPAVPAVSASSAPSASSARPAPPAPTSAELADAATRAALDALAARDFAAVTRAFAPASAPTPAQVAAVWANRAGAMGAVTRWSIADRTRQDGFETRIVRIELERGQLQGLLVITPETDRLASLFLAKPTPPPRYIVPARFREEPITVGAAPYLLSGTLTLPAGPGPFPATVLVHGSGPNDRDSTVGSNKIFKDLAQGLASAGIAVLRYDKRTFQYGDQLTNAITIDEEVVDDAVAATRALAARPEIDARRLFVIGHSLGGLLAPEIAARAGSVAGAVLLAPPGRSPWNILRAQLRYLHAPRETRASIERAMIENTFGGTTGMLGMPHAYWTDLESRDGVAEAASLGKPVLVLHGDRDYQVTAEDRAVWKQGLARVRNVEFATLPGDNHLFIRGNNTPGPAEYKLPGHVDDRVVARTIAFIRRR
ncbi:MAG TPA: alpha/beta fold hydrolase [Kofleriaceae bacterium]|nr:alpha/beta fold hydrolase [Kofleriaceae bacterium]